MRNPAVRHTAVSHIELWVLSLALVLVLLGNCSPAQSPALVVEGGTLIDGTGAAPLRDAVIVIEGEFQKTPVVP